MSTPPITSRSSDAGDSAVALPDGTMLNVRSHAGPHDADAAVLVWGHGLSSSMASEDELGLIDWRVAAPGNRVVRYDARGHGSSDSTPDLVDYRWDRLATDQLALADVLDVHSYVAGGASMGCATALFAALAAPDRVRGLLLVIPPTAWDTRRAQVGMYATMAEMLEAGQLDALVAGVDAAPTPDPFRGSDAWKDRARRTLRSADPARLSRVFRGAGLADLPDPDQIAGIEHPTLILAWSGDPGHPVASAERLHELIGDSELAVATTAEELATWSGRVSAFLAELPARPQRP